MKHLTLLALLFRIKLLNISMFMFFSQISISNTVLLSLQWHKYLEFGL